MLQSFNPRDPRTCYSRKSRRKYSRSLKTLYTLAYFDTVTCTGIQVFEISRLVCWIGKGQRGVLESLVYKGGRRRLSKTPLLPTPPPRRRFHATRSGPPAARAGPPASPQPPAASRSSTRSGPPAASQPPAPSPQPPAARAHGRDRQPLEHTVGTASRSSTVGTASRQPAASRQPPAASQPAPSRQPLEVSATRHATYATLTPHDTIVRCTPYTVPLYKPCTPYTPHTVPRTLHVVTCTHVPRTIHCCTPYTLHTVPRTPHCCTPYTLHTIPRTIQCCTPYDTLLYSRTHVPRTHVPRTIHCCTPYPIQCTEYTCTPYAGTPSDCTPYNTPLYSPPTLE